MKNRAYSYIEIIFTLFIVFLLILPTLKISSQQLNTNIKTNSYNDDLMFFNSLVSHLKTLNYNTSEEIHIDNYEKFKNHLLFKNLDIENIKLNNFNLNINIKKIKVDFHIENISSYLIFIDFKNHKNELSTKILLFS